MGANPSAQRSDAERAVREFIDYIRITSPIAAEKLATGQMEDEELESRFGVFLKDRPALSGKFDGEAGVSPRTKVAELLKRDSAVASNDTERLALAERFLTRLTERSAMAGDSLRSGKMPAEELQSRVAVFISDLKAEAVAAKLDPSAVALEAVIDSFVRANFGRDGERVGAISYRGSLEENGAKREFVIFRKRPEKFRMHFVKDGLVVSVLGYDGGNAWRQAPGKAAQRIPAGEIATLHKVARFDPPLVDYRERGAQVKRDGKAESGPITLRIHEADGSELVSTIDPKTLSEVSTRMQRPGGGVEETRYKDHRKAGVLTVAHVQEQWVDGVLRSTTRIDQVRSEPGLLDSFFAQPENQNLGFMDYMGALVVIKERAAQQAATVNSKSAGGTP